MSSRDIGPERDAAYLDGGKKGGSILWISSGDQNRKGNQRHFGMKAQIEADAGSGLVHSLEATPTNVSDISQSRHQLHGEENRVHAYAGYTGVEKREEFEGSRIEWMVAQMKVRPKAASKESKILLLGLLSLLLIFLALHAPANLFLIRPNCAHAVSSTPKTVPGSSQGNRMALQAPP